MVSYDDAWVKMAISALSAQRAQFTFSTQGIVTHSQARGGEAGSQPTFFMSARPKPAETLGLSLTRLCAAQFCAYAYKDALKEYRPTFEKVFKWSRASSPAVGLLEDT